MAGTAQAPRPQTVRCAFPGCPAVCCDLPREAQLDGSPWRGRLHCGQIPRLDSPDHQVPGATIVLGHVGHRPPPSLQLAALPQLLPELRPSGCDRSCRCSCSHQAPADAVSGLFDLRRWETVLAERRLYLCARYRQARFLTDAAAGAGDATAAAAERRLCAEQEQHFLALGPCPLPLAHQVDLTLPAAEDSEPVVNTPPGPRWLLGEASRVPAHLIPKVNVRAIEEVHCALWPWFQWRQWRQIGPQGQLHTGFC